MERLPLIADYLAGALYLFIETERVPGAGYYEWLDGDDEVMELFLEELRDVGD